MEFMIPSASKKFLSLEINSSQSCKTPHFMVNTQKYFLKLSYFALKKQSVVLFAIKANLEEASDISKTCKKNSITRSMKNSTVKK